MIAKNQFKSIIDLIRAFPTEVSAHHYLASQRWGDGYMECPYEDCDGDDPYIFKDQLRYKCRCCKRIYTAKTGTIFESSKLPMIKWFTAIYLVMHKKGISSIQLAKDITVQQKTAWFMLHRIRYVLGNDGTNKDELKGEISLDESFVGGKNKNRHHDKKVVQCQGRSFKDKTPVMGMMQANEYEYIERPNKIDPSKTVKERIITVASKVRCRVVPDTKTKSLQPIIRANVAKASIVISDEWWAYRGLNNVYKHEVVDHGKGQYKNDAGYSSNNIEGFWSGFKKGIIGIYHQVSKQHLNLYVSEFEFKHNWRNLDIKSQIDGILLYSNCRLRLIDLKPTF